MHVRSTIVFTLTGTDRVGIVEEVTRVLLDLGGNIETSRMARLGGEFAILMLLSLPADGVAGLDVALAHLTGEGYKVTATPTVPSEGGVLRGWPSYRIEVKGADHEGIIHEIAGGLAELGINIESVETGTVRAPLSGAPLFTMTAVVMVPPGLADGDWTAALREACERSGVDVEVSLAGQP